MAWTYILECADGFFYVGSTRNIEQRAWEHGFGGSRFTSKRLPVKMVWAQEFENIGEAYEMERRLHGWSRAKKQALIDGRFEDLPRLARRGGPAGSGPAGTTAS